METAFKLLMVEDSPEDAELLLRTLRKGGMAPDYSRVQTAEALSRALESDRWDVVISDYSMPGFDGTQALAMVHEADADLPFLFFSGTLEVEVAVEAMRQGASDYFLKGHWNHLTRLVPAVRREVEKRGMRRRLKQALVQSVGEGKLAEAAWPGLTGLAGAILRDLAEPLGQMARKPWGAAAAVEGLGPQLEALGARLRTLEAFSRLRKPGLGSTDLNLAAADLEDYLGPQRAKGLELIRRLERNLPPVWADPAHVHQILVNLGLEILEMGGSTGPLEIETGRLVIGPVPGPGENGKPLEYGMLRLRDLGQRSESAAGGIKLALAEAMVLQNGGQLTMEELEGARCFRICFPFWRP